MQPLDILDAFHGIEFAVQPLGHPIEGGYMSSPAAEQQMPAVLGVSHLVGTELHVQIEMLCRRLKVHVVGYLGLSVLGGGFALVGLQLACGFLE